MPTNVKLYLTTGETMTEDDRLKITLDSIAADTFPPNSHNHNAGDIIGGRNLLIVSTFTLDRFLNVLGGLNTSSVGEMTSDYIPVIPNTEYTYSGVVSDSYNVYICFYDSEKTFIGTRLSFSNALYKQNTFSTISNAYFMRISNVNLDVMKLERGNKPTDWTPAPEDMLAKSELVDTNGVVLIDKVPNIPNSKLTQLEGRLDLLSGSIFNYLLDTQNKIYESLIPATIARLASPAFTGNPTAPTQLISDNSTRLATTEFTKDLINDTIGFEKIILIAESDYTAPSFVKQENTLYIVYEG